ncbi:Trm112 family protein [Roseateles koreensis]|uniref:UPF0434 protein PRZ01_01565 n=1 Tax=Roseateles koreensis TaxID=2987526 RepID=A0ABT5KPU7_9BURK|nr:Trm112 family protein [Roseateles koreensis]MDC8783876.1 Trm112 family protein [Roseateles koreensis]
MDTRLIEILVCPLCKGPLHDLRGHQGPQSRELLCRADRLAFPVRDGIPVMLAVEARSYDPETEDSKS